MKLAIIGAGGVGGTLGAAWAALWIHLALNRRLGREWAFAVVRR